MKMKLLSSYRGVLTAEIYYEAGDYEVGADMPLPYAERLVEAKRAEWIEEPKPEPEPEPKPEPKAKPKRSRKKKADQ
jgi:hypothetical protein